MSLDAECARKGRLLDLFEVLEYVEKTRMRNARREKPGVRYEKMINDTLDVVEVGANNICLARRSGKLIRSLEINSEIASKLRVGDSLSMIIGLSQGRWRVILIKFIISKIGANGEMHVSGRNPFKEVMTRH